MLLADVLAQDNSSTGSNLFSFLPIVLIIAAMYFLLIRPNNKRRRDAMQMQSSLGVGDEVRTAGGLFGTVVEVGDDSVTLEASPGVNLRFTREAITKIVNKAGSEDEDGELLDEESEDDSPEADRARKNDRD